MCGQPCRRGSSWLLCGCQCEAHLLSGCLHSKRPEASAASGARGQSSDVRIQEPLMRTVEALTDGQCRAVQRAAALRATRSSAVRARGNLRRDSKVDASERCRTNVGSQPEPEPERLTMQADDGGGLGLAYGQEMLCMSNSIEWHTSIRADNRMVEVVVFCVGPRARVPRTLRLSESVSRGARRPGGTISNVGVRRRRATDQEEI